jgi:uncharacterized protein YcaQ
VSAPCATIGAVPRAATEISAAAARRIAIAAQRLADPPRPDGSPADRGHLRRLLEAIGLLQIDSVNVLARAHYLPVFARLGPYPTAVLDGAAWPARPADRLLLETWAHVASLVPVQAEPLLRWRRFRDTDGWMARHRPFADQVLAVVRERGALSAGEIEKALEAPGKNRSGWWEWSHTKMACEQLFIAGLLGVATRKAFERRYDLAERVVPPQILRIATPDEADAKRELTALAARHHGIGTARDLADYYRIKVGEAKRALSELAEDGTVEQVRVRGWTEPAYLHRDARVPRQARGRALLCPFDPLIWERARTERLFGIRYRIEIYTPAPRRVYGYYVFPLLVGDRIVGRFDLKADRAGRRLLVQSAWRELGAPVGQGADEVVPAAAQQLRRMASWLGLDDVGVADRGDLAAAVRAELP